MGISETYRNSDYLKANSYTISAVNYNYNLISDVLILSALAALVKLGEALQNVVVGIALKVFYAGKALAFTPEAEDLNNAAYADKLLWGAQNEAILAMGLAIPVVNLVFNRLYKREIFQTAEQIADGRGEYTVVFTEDYQKAQLIEAEKKTLGGVAQHVHDKALSDLKQANARNTTLAGNLKTANDENVQLKSDISARDTRISDLGKQIAALGDPTKTKLFMDQQSKTIEDLELQLKARADVTPADLQKLRDRVLQLESFDSTDVNDPKLAQTALTKKEIELQLKEEVYAKNVKILLEEAAKQHAEQIHQALKHNETVTTTKKGKQKDIEALEKRLNAELADLQKQLEKTYLNSKENAYQEAYGSLIIEADKIAVKHKGLNKQDLLDIIQKAELSFQKTTNFKAVEYIISKVPTDQQDAVRVVLADKQALKHEVHQKKRIDELLQLAKSLKLDDKALRQEFDDVKPDQVTDKKTRRKSINIRAVFDPLNVTGKITDALKTRPKSIKLNEPPVIDLNDPTVTAGGAGDGKGGTDPDINDGTN